MAELDSNDSNDVSSKENLSTFAKEEYHLWLTKLDTIQSSFYSTLLPYQIDQVRSILLTTLPLFSLADENTEEELKKDRIIIDATAHIGGDAIHFSKLFPNTKIICIDNDVEALRCLRINIQKFSDPSRFEVIESDCLSYIRNNKPYADFFYFDPPWGGPRYYEKDNIYLFLNEEPIDNIINYILDHRLSSHIILKVPRNFLYSRFKEKVCGDTSIYYVRKPHRNGSVAYGLIHIREHID